MTPETNSTPAPRPEDVQEAPTTTGGNGGSQAPNQEPPTNGPYASPETTPVQSFAPSHRPV
jgi:hypothetical protein